MEEGEWMNEGWFHTAYFHPNWFHEGWFTDYGAIVASTDKRGFARRWYRAFKRRRVR